MSRQQCCDRCTSMTGTSRGLDDLRSDRGYKHHSWPELLAAKVGCPLCNVMYEHIIQSPALRHDHFRIVCKADTMPLPRKRSRRSRGQPSTDYHFSRISFKDNDTGGGIGLDVIAEGGQIESFLLPERRADSSQMTQQELSLWAGRLALFPQGIGPKA
jgi:hypothetical protein